MTLDERESESGVPAGIGPSRRGDFIKRRPEPLAIVALVMVLPLVVVALVFVVRLLGH